MKKVLKVMSLLIACACFANPALADWKRKNDNDLYPTLKACLGAGHSVQCKYVAKIKGKDPVTSETMGVTARLIQSPILEYKPTPGLVDDIYCLQSDGYYTKTSRGCKGKYVEVKE